MRSSSILVALAAALLVLAACGTTLPTPVPVALTLAASSSTLPLASDLAAGYEAAYPYVIVEVAELANTQAAAQAVQTGRADLALLTLPPEQEPAPLRATQIATGALALVVNPANPLAELTSLQVRTIFEGKARDWREVGGGEGTINPLSREAGSGARVAFEKAIMDERPITAVALVIPSETEMAQQVQKDAGAIGYLLSNWQDDRLKALDVEGAGPERVVQGQPGYPLQVPIFLATVDPLSPDVAEFASFIRGPAGRRIIARGYRPATGGSP